MFDDDPSIIIVAIMGYIIGSIWSFFRFIFKFRNVFEVTDRIERRINDVEKKLSKSISFLKTVINMNYNHFESNIRENKSLHESRIKSIELLMYDLVQNSSMERLITDDNGNLNEYGKLINDYICGDEFLKKNYLELSDQIRERKPRNYEELFAFSRIVLLMNYERVMFSEIRRWYSDNHEVVESPDGFSFELDKSIICYVLSKKLYKMYLDYEGSYR